MYNYVTGPIMIGDVDIAAIIDNIITFILSILKFEVPEIGGIIDDAE